MGDSAMVNNIVRGITGICIVAGLVACGQTNEETVAPVSVRKLMQPMPHAG